MTIITVIKDKNAASFTTITEAANYVDISPYWLGNRLNSGDVITLKGFTICRTKPQKNHNLKRSNTF